MMNRLAAALLITGLPLAALAQVKPPPGTLPPPGAAGTTLRYGTSPDQVVPSFEQKLFPPELVMQMQRELELTTAQRTTISDAVKTLQNQMVDLQWNLQSEQATLMELLDQRPVKEQAAVAQISKLLELEATVKRTHLTTLIRIKNTLTDKQVQLLNEAQSRWYRGWKEPSESKEFDEAWKELKESWKEPFEWKDMQDWKEWQDFKELQGWLKEFRKVPPAL